jgi:hypothetical protein
MCGCVSGAARFKGSLRLTVGTSGKGSVAAGSSLQDGLNFMRHRCVARKVLRVLAEVYIKSLTCPQEAFRSQQSAPGGAAASKQSTICSSVCEELIHIGASSRSAWQCPQLQSMLHRGRPLSSQSGKRPTDEMIIPTSIFAVKREVSERSAFVRGVVLVVKKQPLMSRERIACIAIVAQTPVSSPQQLAERKFAPADPNVMSRRDICQVSGTCGVMSRRDICLESWDI